MKVSKEDVLRQVGSVPETSFQIHHDVQDAFGFAKQYDVEKMLKELAEEGQIQSGKRKIRFVGVRSVYWRE